MSTPSYTLTGMAHLDDHTSRIVEDLDAIPDPAERARTAGAMLDKVPTLQQAIREVRQGAVQELRRQGMTFAEVGTAIGVTRGRAQQIAEGKTQSFRKKPSAQPEP